MGEVMSALMPKVGGRADGKRVSAAVRGASLARRQLTLDNTVAAELAGSEDAVLRALRGPPRRATSTCAATCSPSTATPATCRRRRPSSTSWSS